MLRSGFWFSMAFGLASLADPLTAQCERVRLEGGPIGYGGFLVSPGCVALDGERLALGGQRWPWRAPVQSHARVLVRTPTGWMLEAEFSGADLGDPEPEDGEIGSALALQGDTLVLGAPGVPFFLSGDAGLAFVYTRTASGWNLVQEIGLPDSFPREDSGRLGAAVALVGDTLALGAPSEFPTRGTVYVLERSAGSFTLTTTLFGADSGSIQDQFGSALACDGEFLFVGAPELPIEGTGAVHVYRRSASGWTRTQILRSALPTPGAAFGHALALTPGRLAVAAPGSYANPDGSVHLFERTGDLWQESARLDGPPASRFGEALALSGDQLAVGAPGDDGLAEEAGAVRLFRRELGVWNAVDVLVGSDIERADGFGRALARGGATLVAVTSQAGAAYDFTLDDPACPQASFVAVGTTGPAPLTTSFTDTSVGTITAHAWNFGDGSTSSEPNPIHVYTEPGAWSVSLLVQSPAGARRIFEAALVHALHRASATIRRGPSLNPECYSSPDLPVRGGSWLGVVDARGTPGVRWSVLMFRKLPSPGMPTCKGDLLVSLASPLLGVSLRAPDPDGLARHPFTIPADIAFDGFTCSSQAYLLGGGGQFCNAIDLVVGE